MNWMIERQYDWFRVLAWLGLCVVLALSMIVVASAQTIAVCDFDAITHGLLKPEDYGLKLKRQYYDDRARVWIAEYENDTGALVIVRQSLSEAFWTEANQ